MTKLTGLACLAFTLFFASLSGKAHADEPQGVVRTFAVLLNFDESVDFTDDDSVLVMAERRVVSSRILQFAGFGEDLDGTLLSLGSPGAMYLLAG